MNLSIDGFRIKVVWTYFQGRMMLWNCCKKICWFRLRGDGEVFYRWKIVSFCIWCLSISCLILWNQSSRPLLCWSRFSNSSKPLQRHLTPSMVSTSTWVLALILISHCSIYTRIWVLFFHERFSITLYPLHLSMSKLPDSTDKIFRYSIVRIFNLFLDLHVE